MATTCGISGSISQITMRLDARVDDERAGGDARAAADDQHRFRVRVDQRRDVARACAAAACPAARSTLRPCRRRGNCECRLSSDTATDEFMPSPTYRIVRDIQMVRSGGSVRVRRVPAGSLGTSRDAQTDNDEPRPAGATAERASRGDWTAASAGRPRPGGEERRANSAASAAMADENRWAFCVPIRG